MDIGTSLGLGAGNYREGSNEENSLACATGTGALIAADVVITAYDLTVESSEVSEEDE